MTTPYLEHQVDSTGEWEKVCLIPQNTSGEWVLPSLPSGLYRMVTREDGWQRECVLAEIRFDDN